MPYTARNPGRRRGASNRGPRRRDPLAQPPLPFPGPTPTGPPPVRRGEEGPWQRRHLARLLFSLLTAILIANALIGDRGLPATLRIRHEHRELAAAIDALRAANESLRHEAERLRNDPAAIEALARRDLGLMRPGERLFIVTDRLAPGGDDDEDRRARHRAVTDGARPRDLLASN